VSKRIVSAAFLAVVLSLATPVFASPGDDHSPGIAGRISRIIAKIGRAIGLRPTPQDEVGWPKP
jgi:hypothetical protein